MKTPEINAKLRNYLITAGIPLAFINFQKSLISDKYDGRGFNKDYQILVLEKPDSAAFEIEPIQWKYSAGTVLVVFDCLLETISVIPLELSFTSIDRNVEDEYNFCHYQSLKICEKHIMITAIGREHDEHHCLDIALFKTDGQLVAVWKTENCNALNNTIYSFHQLHPEHWIVNLAFNKREQPHSSVRRLCLLSLNTSRADSLSLHDKSDPTSGTLLASKTDEIRSWFSEEIGDKAHLFVLASHYQCCIYRPDVTNKSLKARTVYDKIADINLEFSFISRIRVELTDDSITVNFHDGSSFIKKGSFCLVLN